MEIESSPILLVFRTIEQWHIEIFLVVSSDTQCGGNRDRLSLLFLRDFQLNQSEELSRSLFFFLFDHKNCNSRLQLLVFLSYILISGAL